jgi:hypothetical protein
MRSFPLSPAFPFGCLFLAALLLAGCAITNRDNRRTLNQLDAWVRPESTAAKAALAPVAVPVGTAAGLTDMLLVHPVCVIPDAADDVYQLYWKPRDMDFLRKTLLVPFCILATPPTFVADWLFRSIFDVPGTDDEDEPPAKVSRRTREDWRPTGGAESEEANGEGGS